jgi:hypothetical protein
MNAVCSSISIGRKKHPRKILWKSTPLNGYLTNPLRVTSIIQTEDTNKQGDRYHGSK